MMQSPLSPQHMQLLAPATQIGRDRAERKHRAAMQGAQQRHDMQRLGQEQEHEAALHQINHQMELEGINLQAKHRSQLQREQQELSNAAEVAQFKRDAALRNLARGGELEMLRKSRINDRELLKQRMTQRQLENILYMSSGARGEQTTGSMGGGGVAPGGGAPAPAGPGGAPMQGGPQMSSPGMMSNQDSLTDAVFNPLTKSLGNQAVALVNDEVRRNEMANKIFSRTMAKASLLGPTMDEEGNVISAGIGEGPKERPGGLHGMWDGFWSTVGDHLTFKHVGAIFGMLSGDREPLTQYMYERTQDLLGIFGQELTGEEQGRIYAQGLINGHLKDSFLEVIDGAAREQGLDTVAAANAFNAVWSQLGALSTDPSAFYEQARGVKDSVNASANPEAVEEFRAIMKGVFDREGDRETKAAYTLALNTISDFFGDAENGDGLAGMQQAVSAAIAQGADGVFENPELPGWINGIQSGLSDTGRIFQHAIDPYVITTSEKSNAVAAIEELLDEWNGHGLRQLIELQAGGADLDAYVARRQKQTSDIVQGMFNSLPSDMKTEDVLNNVQKVVGNWEEVMPLFDEWRISAEAAIDAGESMPYASELEKTMAGRGLLKAFAEFQLANQQRAEEEGLLNLEDEQEEIIRRIMEEQTEFIEEL